MVTEKRFRTAKAVLVIAIASLLALSAYEIAHYGHDVKWSTGIDTVAGDNQWGDFSSVQANNDIVIAYYETANGYVKDGLYAFTPGGEQKWAFTNQGSYGINSPTLADNGTVYFGGTLPNESTPSLIALSDDGSVTWNYPLTNGKLTGITIGPEGNIYTNHDIYDGHNYSGTEFIAFSPEGELMWRQVSKYLSPIAVSPNGTVAISSGGNLTGYSPSGEVAWNMPNMSMSFGALKVNDTLYFTLNIGGNEGDQVGIRADLVATSLNGSVLWRYPDYFSTVTDNMMSMSCYTNVIIDDRGDLLFVRSNNTSSDGYISLLAVSQDGELRWEYKDSNIGIPATHGNRIVVSTSTGLTALDLDGHVLWSVNVKGAYGPVAFGPDGTMYLGTWGKLYAIGENPIVFEVGLMILLPVIAVCSITLWRGRKN